MSEHKSGQQIVEYAHFEKILKEAAIAMDLNMSHVMDSIGYSSTAHNGWKRKGSAPSVAFWAVTGVYHVHKKDEDQKAVLTDDKIEDMVIFCIKSRHLVMARQLSQYLEEADAGK